MKNINKTSLMLTLCALASTIVIMLCYPMFNEKALEFNVARKEQSQEKNVQDAVFASTIPLYYDLKKQENPKLQPYDLFIAPNQPKLSVENAQMISNVIYNQHQSIQSSLGDLHYYIKDNSNDTTLIRGDEETLKKALDGSKLDDKYALYIAFTFDENGVITIQNFSKENFSHSELTNTYYETLVRLFSSNSSIRLRQNIASQNYGEYADIYPDENAYFIDFGSNSDFSLFEPLKNTSFVYAMDQKALAVLYENSNYPLYDNYIYSELVLTPFYLLLGVAFLLVLIFRTPFDKPIPIYKYVRKIPAEIIIGVDLVLILGNFYGQLIDPSFTEGLNSPSYLLNIALPWFLIFSIVAYSLLFYKEMFTTGSWRYQFYSIRMIRWMKRKFTTGFNYAVSFDLSNEDDKRIGAVVLINFIILFIITIMWAFGIFFLIIYSVLIFIIAKKYIHKVRQDYRTMLDVTKRIASGDLEHNVEEDMGMFNSFKDDMVEIRTGFKNAVEEEVHSQRMKTELISNVSHDLKTPLTSIITYVDLLKKEDLSKEERIKYIDVLDRNSIRLKRLIEDLFEISKANSGNIKIERMKIDICSLMHQVEVELEDKLVANKLEIRNQFSDDKITCNLDPQKTYRIFENLVANIGKYAMPSTRVYVDITDYGNTVEVSLKNISAAELNFNPDDITERFTRGDASRNTDGSGLGLSIARSFTEIQQGTLNVYIDGDLFKVVLRLPKEEVNS